MENGEKVEFIKVDFSEEMKSNIRKYIETIFNIGAIREDWELIAEIFKNKKIVSINESGQSEMTDYAEIEEIIRNKLSKG